MQDNAVLVVVEVTSVRDAEGLGAYVARASALIGSAGGTVIGRGGRTLEGEAGFGPLVIQRWPSEGAFRAWMGGEIYAPLLETLRASADVRVAIVPIGAGPTP